MFSSSSTMRYPETPSTRNPLQYRPLNSSPLIESPESPKSSPAAAAQARRKSQFKSLGPTTPLFSRTRGPSRRSASSSAVDSDPQRTFLRDRLQARCLERATKARERAVSKTRQFGFGPSSDDQAMDDGDDGEEDDDDIMQDELFRRIVANANRREKHSYRLSYAQEVGSSFDPELEDISSWEAELSGMPSADSRGGTKPPASTSGNSNFSSWPVPDESDEYLVTPDDLDEEELAEYAEEYYRNQGAVADFEDLPPEELFGWSGQIDSEPPSPSKVPRELTEDDGMDIS
ncbi:hypothetical protein JR316_0009789 [Psilocybe cubensis]|uniref:Uncharacterized protein n=2 Tax=Psilocybe cubensis TaxID=181762 RepID=A0ACB8GQB7_PSICU|nr:hypothetical protein JR316_0009789 [Psilocybe cubensis]KAH9477567.1 hypothetical protein JR316_0009789 [Psilocybe cubensis]